MSQGAGGTNFGRCVDLFAPGDDIVSASSDCSTCFTSRSGTSQAAAHAAGIYAHRNSEKTGNLPKATHVKCFCSCICVGIAAVILSSNQNMSPVQVLQMMLRYATRHTINFLPLSETHRLITPNLVAAVPAENRKGQWITAETCTQACLHYFQRQQQSKALPKRQIFFLPTVYHMMKHMH